MLAFHLSTFKVDATPPLGHPLCGGWIKPAVAVDDHLWLRGLVLEGAGLPIVITALDWTGVLNESYRAWTEALAQAAHTTPDRVALHCVHQHNAPFVDRQANQIVVDAGTGSPIHDGAFVTKLMEQSQAAVRQAMEHAQPVSHVRYGDAKVEQVASNRRILGPDGKVRIVRYSATKDPAARAAPEGTIDPLLRSIGLYQRDRLVARIYFYTTHPMSYYGDGRVTSDFVGLARDRRDGDEPDALHLYFTGCAGNVTAGKYNDGSHEYRGVLANRVYNAMVNADRDSNDNSRALESTNWTTLPFHFAPRADLDIDRLTAIVQDPKQTLANRNRDAMAGSWLRRLERKQPILLGRLDLGGVSVLHLPAETFVEYQLDAQAIFPDRPLATAAYGDGGPWYIPLKRSYEEGGYEPAVSWVSADTEPRYRAAITELLRSPHA
jgi:hypothetical protein